MTSDPPCLMPRRNLLTLATATGAALAALPAFTASAAPRRSDNSESYQGSSPDTLWWQAPADDTSMIEQGLPVGNGRVGALASNDPGHELLLITDATMWTGGLNDTLDADGQFPYGRDDFGMVTTSYVRSGVTYRQIFASRPDDVIKQRAGETPHSHRDPAARGRRTAEADSRLRVSEGCAWMCA